MAKKPGPVAGSLGNTDYYYKSDGTVVDENGIPASARIAAMFAAPPPVEEAAAVVAPKRKKKNNAQIAGVLKNTKYYYAPDGSIIDDQGKPAPDKIAAYFPPQEKREAIAAAMPKAPGIKAATKATGVPSKVIKQFNRNVSIATNLITTNQKIMESYPKLFKSSTRIYFNENQLTLYKVPSLPSNIKIKYPNSECDTNLYFRLINSKPPVTIP